MHMIIIYLLVARQRSGSARRGGKSTISVGVHNSQLTTVIELNAIKSFTTCVDEAPRESTLIYASDKPKL